MKKLVILLTASTFAIACPFLTACDGGEEEEILAPDNNENAGNGNQDKVDNTAEIVKRNISATVGYSNYCWDISIKSNLEKALPGKSIIYGVESGYDYYKYYEHFTFEKELFQKKDNNGNMTIRYSIFAGNEFSNEDFLWYIYYIYKKRLAEGEKLDDSEMDYVENATKLFKKAEHKANLHCCWRLYTQINNKRYFYYYFGIQPY